MSARRVEVGRHAARHDAVHHQAVAEAGVGRAQHVLAQHAAVGMHAARTRHRCRSAPMSPKWLAMRSSSAISARSQSARGGTSSAKRRLDGLGEGHRIGHRAVAGDAAGEPGGCSMAGARHEPVDALVH